MGRAACLLRVESQFETNVIETTVLSTSRHHRTFNNQQVESVSRSAFASGIMRQLAMYCFFKNVCCWGFVMKENKVPTEVVLHKNNHVCSCQ